MMRGLSAGSFFPDILQQMDIQPRDRILDVGCGEGWASRQMAGRASEGLVVGLDASAEMVRKARAQSASGDNLLFVWAGAEDIPWQENFFTKALAVELLSLFESPEKALREICRVLIPGGTVWILNRISKENELSQRSLEELPGGVPLRSAEECGAVLKPCGFENIICRTMPAPGQASANQTDSSFLDPAESRRFRELGALLLVAQKPLS